MLRNVLSALALAAAGLLVAGARADIRDFISDRDNTLYEQADGVVSNGAGVSFFVGRSNSANTRRGLLHFDVSSIPAGATITSASLTLQMTRTSSGAQNIVIHNVNANWGEGASDALFEEGGGAQAEPGDATWLHTFYSNQFWSNPGGDFNPAVLATRSVGGIGSYTWASTPGLIASVQSWLNNPGTNFGWLLQGNEGVSRTTKRFGTHENTGSNRPLLHVEYTIPEPGAASLFLAGLLLVRRR